MRSLIKPFQSKTFWLFLMLSGALTACATRSLVRRGAPENLQVTEETNPWNETGEGESDELDIHEKNFISVKELRAVHFDYNSSDLSNEAREILNANANFLKMHPDIPALSEGHCDERGTVAYNLALGERRAIAVRKYYISLGVSPKRIGTISYGKEKPLCRERSEPCWSQNRRVESKVQAMSTAGSIER